MSGVRVVPPFAARGLLATAVLAGAAWGPALGALAGKLEAQLFRGAAPGAGAMALLVVAILHLCLVPAFVAGLVLARCNQRLRTAAGAGAVFGLGVQIGVSVAAFLAPQSGEWDFGGAFLISVAMTAVVTAGVCSAGFLAARWVTRSLLFEVVEQDGMHCYRCGYDLGSPVIVVCPECGTAAQPQRFRSRWLHGAFAWVRRAARPSALAVAVIVVLMIGQVVAHRTIPAKRFAATFRNAGAEISSWIVLPRDWDGSGIQSSAIAAWVPVPDQPGRYLLVCYIADRRRDLPAMQIVFAAKAPGAFPTPVADGGIPRIEIDVPRDLAERIAREGVPPSLIESFIERAAELGWVPTGGPEFGRTDADSEIDLARHFRR